MAANIAARKPGSGPGHDFLIKNWDGRCPTGSMTWQPILGWVSVGVDHDTAAFAVNSIRSGGSRRSGTLIPTRPATDHCRRRRQQRLAVRLWKRELQRLANELGLGHRGQPPAAGTSKWNKTNTGSSPSSARTGAPSRSSATGSRRIDLGHHNQNGLTVRCELDTGQYPAALSPRTPRWPPSISNAPNSTASGTTLSRRMLIPRVRVYFLTRP